MSIYELPKFKLPKLKTRKLKFSKAKHFKYWTILVICLSIFCSSIFGFLAGAISGSVFYSEIREHFSDISFEFPDVLEREKIIERITEKEYIPQTTREEKIIKVVKEVSPSVVSIIITKEVALFEEYYESPFGELFPEFQVPKRRQTGTTEQNIGGGTGFVISQDGMILTNKHVVSEEGVKYTILTNDGERFPAELLAKDPLKDLAVLKITVQKQLKPLKLGDSDGLQIGQTVIAIGNALGEFRNTVSVGVVSGLRRTVLASGARTTELLENVIQTDAAINRGNSGGPLLNLKGEVIGVNVATSEFANDIGFSIPINQVDRAIESVKKRGKIVYPFLGVHYTLINKSVQNKDDLPVDYGAWVVNGKRGPAVVLDSAAEKAGLREFDIILEINQQRIDSENTLAELIQKYEPNDKVILKILRNDKEKITTVILGEISG